jgi:hypothetical protein
MGMLWCQLHGAVAWARWWNDSFCWLAPKRLLFLSGNARQAPFSFFFAGVIADVFTYGADCHKVMTVQADWVYARASSLTIELMTKLCALQVLLADASGFQPFCHKQEQDEPRQIGPWTAEPSHPSHLSITSSCVREVEVICGNKEAKGKTSNITQRATQFEGGLLVIDNQQSIPDLRAPVFGNIGKLFHIAVRWEVEEVSGDAGQAGLGNAAAGTGGGQWMVPPSTSDLQQRDQADDDICRDDQSAAAAGGEETAAPVATSAQGPHTAPQLGAETSSSPSNASSTPTGSRAAAEAPTAPTWVSTSSRAAASQPPATPTPSAAAGGAQQLTWRVYAAVRCTDKCPGALRVPLQSTGVSDLKKRFPKRMELARTWLEKEEARLSMQLVLPAFRPSREQPQPGQFCTHGIALLPNVAVA